MSTLVSATDHELRERRKHQNRPACFAAYLIITVTASVKSRRPAPFIAQHLHRVLLQPSYEIPHQPELNQPPEKTSRSSDNATPAIRCTPTEALIDGTSHPPFEAAASSVNKDLGQWFQDWDHSTIGRRLSDWHTSDLATQNGQDTKWQRRTWQRWNRSCVGKYRAWWRSRGTPPEWPCRL